MAGQQLTIVAKMKAKAGMEEKVREELMALVAPTCSESGCINYYLHQSAEDKSLFLFYENWASKQDFEAHVGTPHLKALLGKAEQILAQPIEITLWEKIS